MFELHVSSPASPCARLIELGRKRGCALVCPDGDLSCMQGKRLVLASTEQLHERISELEAALAQAHRRVSTSTSHPLLSTAHLDGGLTVKASQSPSHPSSQDHSPGKLGNQDLHRLSPDQRSSSRSSFSRGRGGYSVVDPDDGELLGEDSEDEG